MYCVTVEGLANTVLKDKNVLFCMETAAGYSGLSNGFGIPAIFYTTDDIITTAYQKPIKVGEIDFSNTQERNGVIYTNSERTICELIKYDGNIQDILEGMSNYYFRNGESFGDSLMSMVKKYGIEKEFEDFRQDAIEYYDEY